MLASDQIAFENPSRKVIRIFLIIAAILLASALPPAVILAHVGLPNGQPPTSAQLGCESTIVTAVALAMGALLTALLTIPAARKTDRCFNDFLAGNILAEWTYTPDEWQAFVAAEGTRIYKTEWVIFVMVVGISVAVFLFIAWNASSTMVSKLTHCGYILAGAGVFAAIYFLLGRLYSRHHRNQLLKYPKAYISRRAVFCGGDFNFWGSDMRGLESARILAGNPPVIEVIIGFSVGGQRAMAVVDAVTLLAGRPTYASGRKERQVIPIPQGKEAEAEQIVKTLMPQHPAPAPKAPESRIVRAAAPPPAPVAPPLPPAALALRRRARRAWAITAALFVLGLANFILVDVFDSSRPAGQPQSGATTTAALLGCGLWLACPIFLICAIMLTFKTRRAFKQ